MFSQQQVSVDGEHDARKQHCREQDMSSFSLHQYLLLPAGSIILILSRIRRFGDLPAW